MAGADIPRYRTTFRQAEVALIRSAAEKGQSICLVGVSGVGKSNLIYFLYSTETESAEQPPGTLRLIIPCVDCRQWQGTPQSLWELMLDALIRCEEAPTPPSRGDVALSAEALTRQHLWNCVGQKCKDPQTRLMFLLDDFDEILETGPLEMLETLNALRGECRDRLSYLVFTKRLPHILGRAYQLETRSKFYGLFKPRVYALTPMTPADARQMLDHLNGAEGKILSRAELGRINTFAGGHSGLLRAVYDARRELGPFADSSLPAVLNHPTVREAARQLLRSLHPAEQDAAIRLARDRHTAEDRSLLEHLQMRGLLVRVNSVAWFSPIWELYLRQYAGEDRQP